MQNKLLPLLLSSLSFSAYASNESQNLGQSIETSAATDQSIDNQRQQMRQMELEIKQQIDQLHLKLRNLKRKPLPVKQAPLQNPSLSTANNMTAPSQDATVSQNNNPTNILSAQPSDILEQKTSAVQATETKINDNMVKDKQNFEDMVTEHKISQQAFKDIMKQISDEEDKKNPDKKLIAELEAKKDKIRQEVITKRQKFEQAYKKHQEDLARDKQLLEQNNRFI